MAVALEAEPPLLEHPRPESSRQWEVEKREHEAAEGGMMTEEDDGLSRGALLSAHIASNVARRILILTSLARLS